MRLILTSAGITNNSLRKVLEELVGKDMRVAFIPTAANVQDGPKDWLVKNYNECEKLGPTDIVDISTVDKTIWLPRLRAANVIFMGGGRAIVYLMKWVKKSGLDKELPKLLKRRVYVGISSGSIIATKSLGTQAKFFYSKKISKVSTAPNGLGYVDFYIQPHLGASKYPKITDRYIKDVVKRLKGDLYLLDDQSGVAYLDGKIKVVSEGKWKKYSENP